MSQLPYSQKPTIHMPVLALTRRPYIKHNNNLDTYIWCGVWVGVDLRIGTHKTCIQKKLDYMFQIC